MTKSSGGNKGDSSIEFPRELPSAEHILARIKTITGELGALQADIYGKITDAADLLDRRSLLETAGAAGVLVEFKLALDQLRSILWFCESGGSLSNTVPSSDGGSHRRRELPRADELLKTLSPSALNVSSQNESASFFERLDRVIDNFMQDDGPKAKTAERFKAQR